MSVTQHLPETLIDRALVAAFLDYVPHFVFFKDRQGRFLAVSKSKLRRNGLQHEHEIIGKTDFDFLAEKDARRTRQDEEEVMRTGVAITGKLEHLDWPDGHETWSLNNKMPWRDESGAIIGTFGITMDVTAAKQTEMALEKTRKELVDASRMTGMAEVATGVLHNVGNVLNSLNVSATIITTGLRQSRIDSLTKVGELLREHTADLADYVTRDPKGRLVPGFIESLARHFVEDRARLVKEVESLQRNVDHIKEIVSMQQDCATMVGIVEPIDATTLMEDALRMNTTALIRQDVQVFRNFSGVPFILAERGKVLQILVNLIRNAKYACDDGPKSEKVITLRIEPGGPGRILLIVQDNGVGIPPENLEKIFNHGFTTRAGGHGFGVHSSANAAREMNGTLSVHSDGRGRGAAFTLDLPEAVDQPLPASG